MAKLRGMFGMGDQDGDEGGGITGGPFAGFDPSIKDMIPGGGFTGGMDFSAKPPAGMREYQGGMQDLLRPQVEPYQGGAVGEDGGPLATPFDQYGSEGPGGLDGKMQERGGILGRAEGDMSQALPPGMGGLMGGMKSKMHKPPMPPGMGGVAGGAMGAMKKVGGGFFGSLRRKMPKFLRF